MRQPKQIYCANDNAPLRARRLRTSFKQVNSTGPRKTIDPHSTDKRKTSASWIIPIIAMLGGAYALWQKIDLELLFWPSFLIGTALIFTTFTSEKDTRLRNISGLVVVAAFTTALSAILAQNGFTLIGVEIALVLSSLSLLIGWAFQCKPAALLSVFSGLFYLGSFFPELGLMTGISDEFSQLGSGLLPWLILSQIILAQNVRSSGVLMAAIIAAYIWLGTLTSEMPTAAIAGLGFAIAAAHYCLGKAWGESKKFGANLHRLCAWGIALSAALYTQSVWMRADLGQAQPVWPPSIIWWSVLAVAMGTLFIASLMRYKSSHITLSGIFIIFLAVAAVPIAAAKPELVYIAFDAVPGLSAHPGLGLIIGAAIIARGFMWLVSGLKHGRILDMSMGAIVIGIEAIILFQPDSFNADLGVIFVVSLICALCFGGLVAGVSASAKHPTGHFA